MNADRLKALIEQADVNPPAQDTTSLELAGRVRVLHRRRQRRRLAVAGAALLGLGGLAWHGLADRQGGGLAKSVPQNPAVPPAQTVPADERLREARIQIDREELLIERLLAAERGRQLASAAEAADTGLNRRLLFDEQVGQAAMTILLTGDQRAKRPDGVQAAREDYVSVIEAFPNTIWAERAGKRLAALKP